MESYSKAIHAAVKAQNISQRVGDTDNECAATYFNGGRCLMSVEALVDPANEEQLYIHGSRQNCLRHIASAHVEMRLTRPAPC